MLRRMLFSVLLALPSVANADTITVNDMVDLGAGVVPAAVNNSGIVVGQNGDGQAFVWQNGTITVLPTLGGTGGAATDVNDNGTVVGWSYRSDGNKHAFKWTSSGGIVDLNPTGANQYVAEAINNSGAVAGWLTNGTTITRSATWNASGAMTTLFGSTNHKAFGIDNMGEIVGVQIDSSGNPNLGYYWNG
jgi:probable HAF family extracellular repeat protein